MVTVNGFMVKVVKTKPLKVEKGEIQQDVLLLGLGPKVLHARWIDLSDVDMGKNAAVENVIIARLPIVREDIGLQWSPISVIAVAVVKYVAV